MMKEKESRVRRRMEEGSEEMNAKLLEGSGNGSEESIVRKVWIESKKLWVVAGPAILIRISTFGLFIIALAFSGRIGNTEMAALSLDFHVLVRFSLGLLTVLHMFISSTVTVILMGMSSGLETLCGQAYGAKQYHMLGIYLQRSWIVESIIVVPTLFLFIFAGKILKLLGQTKEIYVMGNIISLWNIPIVISFIFSFTLQMYLQAQSKNVIIAWVSVPFLILHGLMSWVFVEKIGLGIGGVMLSMNIASWLPILGQLIYVFYGGCPQTWIGFSMNAIVDLWPVVKLSVSSGVMLCVELWYNGVMILLAGKMNNAKIAIDALSICLNINAWELMAAFGFLAGASVRVSNELGKGSARSAKFAVLVVVFTSLAIGVLLWALVLGFRHKISYVFSDSAEVADAVSDLSILLAFSLLLSSVQPVLSGVAVGSGWQSVVAYVNIICYYLLGIPLGVIFGYVLHFGVKGIWIGMMVGTAVQTLVLIGFTCKTDWDEQVCMTKKRLNKWLVTGSSHESVGNVAQEIRASF